LSNTGVRELKINFLPTHVTCVFYVAVQSKKKKFSFPAYVFSFCIVVLFIQKKKSSACLCLLWKQNKPFFKWFSLAFSRTKKKKEKKKGMSMVTGTSPVKKKIKIKILISVGAILCLVVQFCAILAVRTCAILSLWVPVTGYGCWDMRQPIGVSPVQFVSDRL
jgi:hypothetical protein